MNKLRLLTKVLLVSVLLGMSGSAWGDVVNATLDHTASSSRNKDNVITTTVDAEFEHYNNTKAAAWGGWAYAQFSFTIPAGHSIESATLTWSTTIGGNTGTRNNDVYYVNAGTTINYAGLTSTTNLNPAATFIVNVQKNGPATHTGIQTDVTTAIRTISATQNYIIFKWTNNAASADLHGKASANAPTLVITTTAATLYTASFTANNGTITPNITIYSDAQRQTSIANGTLVNGNEYYFTASLEGYKNYEGSFTVNGSNPSVSFTMTEKVKYTYTVNAKADNLFLEKLTSGSYYKDENVNYHYKQVINHEGTLYQAPAISSAYKTSFTLDTDGKVVDHSYSQPATPVTGIVFLAEGEDVLTRGTGSAADIRCSMGAGGYASSKTKFVTLPPGKYSLTISNRCSGTHEAIHKFYKGDDVDPFYSADGVGSNTVRTSGEFTLMETTDLYMQGGDNNQYVDWLYIVKTGDATATATLDNNGYATFAAPYALDLTNLPEGLKAYQATSVDGVNIRFNEVTEAVPANTGLLMEGTADKSYNIPVVASGNDISATNLLKVNANGATFSGETDHTYYAMLKNTYPLVFATFDPSTLAFPATKAYLDLTGSFGARLNVLFGDEEATSIKNLTPALSEGEGAIYTLDGRKANKADLKKGVYVVNGKKVVIK